MEEFDVIVIGAGPAGEVIAGRCADGGLRVRWCAGAVSDDLPTGLRTERDVDPSRRRHRRGTAGAGCGRGRRRIATSEAS